MRERIDLITYLFNYAFDNDIGYVFYKTNPRYPSLAWKWKREIAINMNWHNQDEVPFTIGHEIGHVMLGGPNTKQLCCIAYGTQIEEEKDARYIFFASSLQVFMRPRR